MCLTVPTEQSANNFRSTVEESLGFESEDLRLMFEGKNMEGDVTLEQMGITEASTVEAVLSLKGGKKKKKRK